MQRKRIFGEPTVLSVYKIQYSRSDNEKQEEEKPEQESYNARSKTLGRRVFAVATAALSCCFFRVFGFHIFKNLKMFSAEKLFFRQQARENFCKADAFQAVKHLFSALFASEDSRAF